MVKEYKKARSERVRRQGLEPRTRGLREGRLAAQSAPPALTAQLNARKALDSPTRCPDSFHEPFHERPVGAATAAAVSERWRSPGMQHSASSRIERQGVERPLMPNSARCIGACLCGLLHSYSVWEVSVGRGDDSPTQHGCLRRSSRVADSFGTSGGACGLHAAHRTSGRGRDRDAPRKAAVLERSSLRSACGTGLHAGGQPCPKPNSGLT
jgi:hypothetical protein